MKIAFVGSRDWKHFDFSCDIISDILHGHEIEENFYVVSGGARGIDTQAEQIAKSKGLQTIIFKPDWDKYGKRAGFLRNELIINEADFVVAFWNGESKGTKHSIDLAIKSGKPIDIYVRK
jgi:predicted Rossmann fold nucleotide-binding protein DprA/Smf involved in DNA uptake